MRIRAVQHVAHEGPAAIAAWATTRAFEIEFDGGPSRGGALALALQFHLEATDESVRAMVEADLAGSGCVPGAKAVGAFPGEAELLAAPAYYSAIRPLLDTALDGLTARPAAR